MAENGTALKLCIAEEQEIFRRLYKLALMPEFDVELVPNTSERVALQDAVTKSDPDVLMVGVKSLGEAVLETIAEIQNNHLRLGLVVLLNDYSRDSGEHMRRLAARGSSGIAFFLKQSLVQAEQLIHMVSAVHRGQVILDPALSGTMLGERNECPFLREMTVREQEILALLADGYTNTAIARTLLLDVKTVEHYINTMYSKLKSMVDFDHKHLRVQATRLYLQAKGDLPAT